MLLYGGHTEHIHVLAYVSQDALKLLPRQKPHFTAHQYIYVLYDTYMLT
jgi:hypothetical protein